MARFSATVSIFIDPHQAGAGRAPQTGADAASGDEACHVGRQGRPGTNTTWQSSNTDPQTLGIYSGDPKLHLVSIEKATNPGQGWA